MVAEGFAKLLRHRMAYSDSTVPIANVIE